MPVSHLGLTVSHLPSATSFYLAALQPLGYRYFGSQRDSIGLGVQEADFFLSEAVNGTRPTPTHVAFHAADCVSVRDCYNAALRAGAQPSGKPSFRKDDCKCFNAAVEDLDGNTVEFIFRDTSLCKETEMTDWAMTPSRPMPVRSRTQSTYSGYPETTTSPRGPGLQRSRTEPMNGFSPGAVFGGLLGAATGAAIAYAMVRSERDGSRMETQYSAAWSRGRSDNFSAPRSSRRSASAAGSSRPYSTVEAPRMVMPASTSRSYVDDAQVEYSRHRVSRTASGRSQTYEVLDVRPGSFASRRSATMPMEQSAPLLLDNRSRHSSRRSSVADGHHRHDSVVSSSSRRTVETVKHAPSQASTIKPSRRGSSYVGSAAHVPLPPSVAASRTASRVSARPDSRQFDAYYLPVDTPNEALPPDEDGLDDMRTVVPDDSISCIDEPRVHSSSRSRRSERYGHDARDYDRPSKSRHGSNATAPAARKRESKPHSRSYYSDAR